MTSILSFYNYLKFIDNNHNSLDGFHTKFVLIGEYEKFNTEGTKFCILKKFIKNMDFVFKIFDLHNLQVQKHYNIYFHLQHYTHHHFSLL